jgi:hypothetical protein
VAEVEVVEEMVEEAEVRLMCTRLLFFPRYVSTSLAHSYFLFLSITFSLEFEKAVDAEAETVDAVA